MVLFNKALRYKLFFLKALSKRLRKLTIKTNFLTKIGGNNKFLSPVLLIAKLVIKIGLAIKVNN